jgi:hypothetical protein
MSTIPLAPWGPFYGNAPLLQDAVNHAERLSGVLKTAVPRDDDERAAAWLAGRVDEIEVFVDLTVGRWRIEGVDERAAANSIVRYLDAMHRGLALHFGELRMKCCCDGLFSTSVPTSQTTETEDDLRTTDVHAACDTGVDASNLLGGLPGPDSAPTQRA